MNAHADQSVAEGSADTGRSPDPARPIGAQVLGLGAFLGASALVAAVGSAVTIGNVNGWYVNADKAPWSPPSAAFGPVWTLLYVAMAVAAWLVWRQRTPQAKGALWAYCVQLGLNMLWSPVFFGLYPVLCSLALWLAFAIILALAVALTVTVLLSGPISRWAGLLLLPYVSWVVFAASLNFWAAVHN